MHYNITTQGPGTSPRFEITATDRQGTVTVATGPAEGETYARALDYAARLVAYANVALALSQTVNRVADIDNQTDLAAIVAGANS